MKTVFDELGVELDSVQRWLPGVEARRLTKVERELVESLGRYVRQCRDGGRHWASPTEAERVKLKVRRAWVTAQLRTQWR